MLAASIAMGASLQAIVGAFLIRRFTQYPTAFVEARDIIKFLLLGGPVSCLVNATWSVTSLLLGVLSSRSSISSTGGPGGWAMLLE